MNVLITGSTGGLGQSLTAVFLEQGATVLAIDREAAQLEHQRTAAPDPSRVHTVAIDLSDPPTIVERLRPALESLGSIDVLINNAGMITRSATADTTLEDWSQVVNVNLTAAFLVTQTSLPFLERAAAGGRIIVMASRAAQRPHRNAAPSYGATKAALVYLVRHWSVELYDRGILCFGVSPGPVATPMFEALDPAYQARIGAEMITGSAIPPQEIADLVWYLATACGPSLTGQNFACNAGTYWS